MHPVCKISDFENDSWNKLNEERDLFLKSSLSSEVRNYTDADLPNFSKIIEPPKDPYVVYNAPYNSQTTNLASIFSTIVNEGQDISSRWVLSSGSHPSEALYKTDISSFFETFFKNQTNLNSVINLNGTYASNFHLDKNNLTNSTTIDQRTVASVEYSNRLFAMVYNTLRDLILKVINIIIDINSSTHYTPSYVGEIIQGTYTITSNNACRSIYGDGSIIFQGYGMTLRKPNTQWLQHSGDYSLRCASSGVTSKSAKADGGDNSLRRMSSSNLPAHTHTIESHDHGSKTVTVSINLSKFFTSFSAGADNSKKGHTGPFSPATFYTTGACTLASTGASLHDSGLTINNSEGSTSCNLDIQQAYKKCYVWERIS